MAEIITLAGYDLGAVDSGVLLTETSKASAFQRAGRRITLNPTGNAIKSVAGITSYGVGEGKAKTASGTGSKVVVGNNKFAVVTVETIEAWNYDGRVAEAVFDFAPTAHAKAFDAMVAGFAPVPVEFSNFASLSEAQEVEVGLGADASISLDDAAGVITDGSVTAYVLTTAMLAYLKRQRLNSGTRVLDVEGNNVEGTIDGIPYYTITSSELVGYAGNFAERYFWGTADVLSPTFFVKDAGTISDSDGVEHNLTSENKLALFHEIFQGSGVADLSYFARLVPADAS